MPENTPTTPATSPTARGAAPAFERRPLPAPGSEPVSGRAAAPIPSIPAPPAAGAAEKPGGFARDQNLPPATPANPAPGRQPEPAAPGDRAARQLALLARKERQVVLREQSLKAEEQRFRAEQKRLQAAQSAEIEALKKELEDLRGARGNAQKWLEKGGFTYDQLTQQLLNDGNPTAEQLVSKVQKDFEAKLEAERTAREAELAKERAEREKLLEAEQRRIEAESRQTVQNFYRGVLDFGRSNAARFPLTFAFGQEGQVPALIEAAYRQSLEADRAAAKHEGREPVGRILSAEEAWTLMEKHHEGVYDRAQQARAALPTGAAPTTVAPAVPAAAAAGLPAPAPKANEQPLPVERPTLTNAMVSSTPAPASGLLSPDERWKRALAAMDAAKARRP